MEPIRRRNEVLKRIEDNNKRTLQNLIKNTNNILDEASGFPVRIAVTGQREIDSILLDILRNAGWNIKKHQQSENQWTEFSTESDVTYIEVE